MTRYTTLALALFLGGQATAQEIALPEEYDPMLYTDPEAVERGEALYAETCAACHGLALEGEEDWRSADPETGLRGAPPHDGTGHTWHHTDLQNFAVTKYGIEPLFGVESAMTGFGDVLSDAEILDVLAYIKSTWAPEITEMHDKMNAERQ
eukprot:TRINITY_DN46842_c0_g1_i1.p2 TRINITY_DN46842_c0_g1~~TRINITY_DN46842_c0_g1_i1.p2  ORF type:complete len:151 (+),score=34.48 TRINITY_DN46842_c0_g1_i1:2-454(+)